MIKNLYTEVDDDKWSRTGLRLLKKLNEVIDHLNKEEMKKEGHEEGDEYYYIDTDGDVGCTIWHGDSSDHGRAELLGIFKSREKAETRLQQLKELIKTLKTS